ncbi:tRNA dihydrouridine synthase [Euzebya pacifica]|uniref:tRNA dihydrouridine synthase n=1 Tax=Euzebya pacifica TaxID=1608957 RepID=UPI003C6D44FC
MTLAGARTAVTVDPPVVLAPMAGVTNVPFRAVCRAFSDTARLRRDGGPLYVSEMVGARALVEADQRGAMALLRTDDGSLDAESDKARLADELSGGRLRTMLRAAFAPDEPVRSLQLYAIDPDHMRDGVAVLAEYDLVDHIDLNFGCPAPKVTRMGGGAALPWRLGLFAELVEAAVSTAGGRPVTVKMRKGIDADHLTFLEAGRIARDLGVAAVTLHGRTAQDAYGGHADWDAIAALVDAIGDEVPVLGNGDIWQAADAVEMIARTGCAGVVVGRGCLGRPWLFGELEAALAGRPVPPPPNLGQVADTLLDHATKLVDHLGEAVAMRDIRKHTGWYLQGFELGKTLRGALRRVERLEEMADLLGTVDREAPMPESAVSMHRGHTHGPKPVRLPDGWLDSRDTHTRLPAAAGAVVSGG